VLPGFSDDEYLLYDFWAKKREPFGSLNWVSFCGFALLLFPITHRGEFHLSRGFLVVICEEFLFDLHRVMCPREVVFSLPLNNYSIAWFLAFVNSFLKIFLRLATLSFRTVEHFSSPHLGSYQVLRWLLVPTVEHSVALPLSLCIYFIMDGVDCQPLFLFFK
jgi:hypothetical protein